MRTAALRARIASISMATALAAVLLSGCEDVRRFSGEWTGTVAADPNLGLGFVPGATLRARIDEASRTSITMAVQLTPPDWVDFTPVRRAAADALGDMQLPGDPLRNYLGVISPPGASPYFSVTSLYAEDRVELRLIRGAEDAYAVFSLHRATE